MDTKRTNREDDLLEALESTDPSSMVARKVAGAIGSRRTTVKRSNTSSSKEGGGKRVVIDWDAGGEPPSLHDEGEGRKRSEGFYTARDEMTPDLPQDIEKKQYGRLKSIDTLDSHNSRSSGRERDEFGVSVLTFDPERRSTLLTAGDNIADDDEFLNRESGLQGDDEGDDRSFRNRLGIGAPDTHAGKKGDDEDGSESTDGGSVHSKSSLRSLSSKGSRSVYSDKIIEASRRGQENATTPGKKKTRKDKKDKNKKSFGIRQIVQTTIRKATFNLDDVRSELPSSPPLPTTSDLLSASDFDGGMSQSSGGSNTTASRTSVATERYHDKRYLAHVAQSKFQKGLRATHKRRYSLARSKFRAALKARILLHEGIQHLSIAPVHEMIGHVERKLGEFEKARLHLLAALEICEGALRELEAEAEEEADETPTTPGVPGTAAEDMGKLGVPDLKGDGESETGANPGDPTRAERKRILETNIERIQKTIGVVEADAKRHEETAGMTPGSKHPHDMDSIQEIMSSPEDECDTPKRKGTTKDVAAATPNPEARKVEAAVKSPVEGMILEAIQRRQRRQQSAGGVDVDSMIDVDDAPSAGGNVSRGVDVDSMMDAGDDTGFNYDEVSRGVDVDKPNPLGGVASSRFNADASIGRDDPNNSSGQRSGGAKVDALTDTPDVGAHELGDVVEVNAFTETPDASAHAPGVSVAVDALTETPDASDHAPGGVAEVDPLTETPATVPRDNTSGAVTPGASSEPTTSSEADVTDEPDDHDPKSEHPRRPSLVSIQESIPSVGMVSINEDREASFSGLDSDRELKDLLESYDDDDRAEMAAASLAAADVCSSKSRDTMKYQPKGKKGPKPTMKRLSTFNENRLRDRYYSQGERGEEYYGLGQYAMAIASFNDARFALLIIAGLPEKALREDSSAITYAKLRDQINSALLSERITDCQLQKFFRYDRFEEENSTSDYSHVNYSQAATTLSDARKALVKEIELLKKEQDEPSGGTCVGNDVDKIQKDEDLNSMRDLLHESTLSLARIFSKQGRVYAKFDSHQMALDLYEDSIAAWADASKDGKPPPFDIAVDDDPLILETSEVLASHSDADPSKLPPRSSHLKALSTYLDMASSHHALGLEAVTGDGPAEDPYRFEAAVGHHLKALALASQAASLRAFSNISTVGPKELKRLTTRGRDLSVLIAQSDSKDTSDASLFMKRCNVVVAQEEMFLSHACLCLGHRELSRKWVLKAVASMSDLGITGLKNESEVALYILSIIAKGATAYGVSSLEEKSNSADMLSLYEGGLASFPSSESADRPRLLIHISLIELEKGLDVDALSTLKKATEQICSSLTPPSYYEDVLHALDAQIIMNVSEGDTGEALLAMIQRCDVVRRWVGNRSDIFSKTLHRLGCLHSLLGDNEKAIEVLEEALEIIGSNNADNGEHVTLNCLKLLATLQEMDDLVVDNSIAISGYECALALEKDINNKARLMNAISNLYIQDSGQCHLAIEYLEKSLRLQQDVANTNEDQDIDTLMGTMLLYGNAMASKQSYSQAIYWYESALNANPDKSPTHPNNLRAWYNKGVTLLRTGDIIGAGHAFGIILDEVENNSSVAQGTAFVLNAIGSIFFANKDYSGAIERFKESLSLQTGLSRCHRAGTYANIATAYYKSGNYEESEESFKRALRASKSPATKAVITRKYAYILYKQKLYLRAYNAFLDAASMSGNGEDPDDEFSRQCEGYAEACRCILVDRNCAEELPIPDHDILPQKPRFAASLIPITDGHNATRYSDAVYPRNLKMLMALGYEDTDFSALISEDNEVIFERAQENLLMRTRSCQAEYASAFEGMLIRRFKSNVMEMARILEEESKQNASVNPNEASDTASHTI